MGPGTNITSAPIGTLYTMAPQTTGIKPRTHSSSEKSFFVEPRLILCLSSYVSLLLNLICIETETESVCQVQYSASSTFTQMLWGKALNPSLLLLGMS